MATYKELLPNNIKTARTQLSQIVDVLQEDISGSVSRKKYQHFVTGGIGPGVTSSLFQTVYDQDFTMQTANAVFDVTVGLFEDGATVLSSTTGTDSAGKLLFPSSSLMMREKIDNYKQFAGTLLGDTTAQFTAPFDSTDTSDNIDVAAFFAIKRLFARDQIKRETFALKFYQTASLSKYDGGTSISNLYKSSELGAAIYTDVGSATNKLSTFGGQVGNVVNAADVTQTVGLLFYDRGVLVLDLEKCTSGSQFVSGTIDAMNSLGYQTLGAAGTETALTSKFIPDFIVSGSIDNIVDHLCYSRFQSGSYSAMLFQNSTNINSSLIYCTGEADEFNYSSNPTFTDENDRIVVIDEGQEDVQQTFSYITGVGLYDANDNLLAMAKTSRPIEKSPERQITLRVRLDA